MSSNTQGRSTQNVIKDLVKHMSSGLGLDSTDGSRIVKNCLGIVTSHDASFLNSSLSDNDEFAIVDRIKRHLQSTGQDHVSLNFESLHRKLITVESKSHSLRNRTSILSFLCRMSEANQESSINGNWELGRTVSDRSFDSLIVPTANASRSRAGSDVTKKSPSTRVRQTSTSSLSSLNFSNGLPKENTYSINVNTDRRTSQRSERPDTFTNYMKTFQARTHHTGKYEVSEVQIIQDLLFCFQGIEGNILRLDTDNGFKIDPLACVPQTQLVRSMMELGYLHNCVQSYCQELEEGGAVARGVTCAVRDELTSFYRTIASLNADLKQTLFLSEDSPLCEETLSHGGLTLRRLYVRMREPIWLFQVLTDICRECVRQRGGAIVSAAYSCSYHGDPRVQLIATRVLNAATRPLFTLISHWIIEGELFDPDDEFFVADYKKCPSHNRWKDKYYLRKELVPAVMSERQAMMVLNAGRCINFLNEICKHKMEVTGARKQLRMLANTQGGELLQLAEPASPLAIIIESACMEASQLVLDTLKTQFKLYENFQGLRRYMLMGQGDFYHYLMQLLEQELNKSVEHLYAHNLLSILESAVRATNAQFEDKEILSRVSTTLLEASPGEMGWDVFTMVYCTEGPLDTVFHLSDGSYQSMFMFLWQLKRVEYCLSNFRKEHTCMLKKIQLRDDFGDLKALLNHTSLITAEMVHYINQVLYYILFEVIECAFEAFAQKLVAATTIEEVIRDHELFLKEIKTKTLKDDSPKSMLLSTLLSSLNLSILNLLSYGSQFLETSEDELSRRWERDAQQEQLGTCYTEEAQHNLLVRQFNTKVRLASKEIGVIYTSYQDNMRKLLVQLSAEQNDLQLLSTRLDFNEFYKKVEPELSENVTFRRITQFIGVSSSLIRE